MLIMHAMIICIDVVNIYFSGKTWLELVRVQRVQLCTHKCCTQMTLFIHEHILRESLDLI